MAKKSRNALLPLTIAVGSMVLLAKTLSLLPPGTDWLGYVIVALLALLTFLAKQK